MHDAAAGSNHCTPWHDARPEELLAEEARSGQCHLPSIAAKEVLPCYAASRMQELDSQIAQVDQELATQTRNLVRTGEEADQAHREEIELKAEVMSVKPDPSPMHLCCTAGLIPM